MNDKQTEFTSPVFATDTAVELAIQLAIEIGKDAVICDETGEQETENTASV